MCAVPSAPGVAGVRVWAIMSRGRGPRGGPPPLEGVHVDYPPWWSGKWGRQLLYFVEAPSNVS